MSPTQERPVLVVDFGAQYAQLIARRVREAQVYSEIVPHTMPVSEMLEKSPAAIILSGGPASVYAEGAPDVDSAVFDSGVPVFGICYGFQAMANALGGSVARTGGSEYGATELSVTTAGRCSTVCLPADGVDVPRRLGGGGPEGFTVNAATAGAPVAAFEDTSRQLAGVQFHPEVMHRLRAAGHRDLPPPHRGLPASWTTDGVIEARWRRSPNRSVITASSADCPAG